MSENISLIIVIAFLLDCIFGDPQNPLHPIRLIGRGVTVGVRAFKKLKLQNTAAQFLVGAVLVIIVVCVSFIVSKVVVWRFYQVNMWLGITIESVICYFIIAPKALKVESMKVYHALLAGDLQLARENLSYIVGRETKELDEQGVIKATIETIAENLSDGVIAPLIFTFIGGVPLGMAYKAINTLDSMIGYRNEEYEYFGKFAARLDDVVNFIPARVSAMLMIVGSVLIRADTENAVRIYIRDRKKHKSPNAAQTESVCAGALGLRLGGDSRYSGKRVEKPTIGDDINKAEPLHIRSANNLMYSATVLAIALLVVGGAVLRR